MAIFARVCQSITEYDPVWPNMAKYGGAWPSMILYVMLCSDIAEYHRICAYMVEYAQVFLGRARYSPKYGRPPVLSSLSQYDRLWPHVASYGRA